MKTLINAVVLIIGSILYIPFALLIGMCEALSESAFNVFDD
jgi:hypothetical protein